MFLRSAMLHRRHRSVLQDVVAAVFLLVIVAIPTHSVTGDGPEYILMAQHLSHLRGPTASLSEAQDAGVHDLRLVNRDGRQEMWHFWFFPLCVAPLVALTTAVGAPPVVAFAVFNAVLLWILFGLLRRRCGTLPAIFVCLSPIVWWIDKAQVEVFMFVLLAAGFAFLHRLPWAALCFATAATQYPPLVALVGLVGVLALKRRDGSRSDLWLWIMAGLIGCMHPLYYWWHLARLTPLVEGGDLRIPGGRAFVTPFVDLNVGLVFNAPATAIVLAWVIAIAVRTVSRQGWSLVVIGVYLFFLLVFGQAPNVNSGGTPGMTRYALWLIPPVVALFDRPDQWRKALVSVALASAVWSAFVFRPSAPEQFLVPNRFALSVWSTYPALENPLPEIFAERLRHRDGVNTLASTPNCAKVLVQGGQWPSPCAPTGPFPAECAIEGALCYGNRRSDGTYEFVETSRRGGIVLSQVFR